MTLDWQKLAGNYRDQYIEDLTALVAIDSARDDSLATQAEPLGPGPAAALKKFLEIGQRDGFTVKNLDNLAGYIEFGDGDETLAVLSHVDQMPAGEGWETDPYTLTEKDGNLYGRGTSDDKGPGLAAYYGLRMLKDNGISLGRKVRLILGTDEESNWTGMTHYMEVEPAPTLGFSPDAEFPLINGEKGNVTFEVEFKGENAGNLTLVSFHSGLRENMVPRDAVADVKTTEVSQMQAEFETFLAEEPVTGEVETNADGLHFHIIGKAAHGMEPKLGVNAGTYLAKFLNQYPFGGDAEDFLSLIATKLHDDSRANQLEIAYTDDVMGDLTMNVGIMNFDANAGGKVNTNFRYPKGVGPAEIREGLSAATRQMAVTIEKGREMKPHYVDPSDPIVSTLMAIYKRQTGETDAQPEVVGGGTYGRLMERGVAFGALFPWTPSTMHQANEYQPVSDLLRAMAIYGESIYELAK
ncbi:dipeptidase PepV [Levilactobacillus bambusae]|uniref:Dipeptidase PepV n=1 Tax=Levilactobacillus bambusae TaxID=2024736 RepID=A0A2V1N1J8_9LACO|nr:dipeptidase PepV [Levilactobacillus bambusae]PWG01084.1 dipeptidase PepV [Levilactobacillus bambusae]